METFIFVLQIFNLIEINLVLNNDWFSWGQSDGFWLAETALTCMRAAQDVWPSGSTIRRKRNHSVSGFTTLGGFCEEYLHL